MSANTSSFTSSPSTWQAGFPPRGAASTRQRLQSIDALRGWVMVVMLLDHVRENWFLHMQVSDPANALMVDPALFFTRLTSTLCAPVFIALTGLGAYLYGTNHTRAETSAFLVKRGAFLMLLDVAVMTPAWTVKLPPVIWLQVIWCIGVCMIALAALIRFPRPVLVGLGLLIVCGHNLLDGIVLSPEHPLFAPWAMLHQRDSIVLPFATLRTTYPVLPWIGVILLGYGIGSWFERATPSETRQRRLLVAGLAMLAAFLVLRWWNVYGDKPWFDAGTPLRTAMSFLATTKYPPSLLFLLPTLGLGALLLAALERAQGANWVDLLARFGGAPMFFYILHIYVLRLLYHAALAIWGPTHGTLFAVDHLYWVWIWYVGLIVPLAIPTIWFAGLKARRKDIAWLKYL